ncbi:uncharacterized protein LOC128966174 [Oppia nitens]|uniref:uncharacterized protein LOC128966174 n=1 Tax=Oppia nitens TaxID=1686743 RepID=UPI0023DAA2CB|nr:uncharacterized protein LOC128966174 [Oppia nitens]
MGRGGDVVDATIAKVNQIKLFADDMGFLFRLGFGENPPNFADRSQNIWSIDRKKFRKTQDFERHHELLEIYYELADKYDIDWQRLDISDMKTPLYEALATKMFIHLTNQSIPKTIEEQAMYWKQHYKTGGNVQKFIAKVNQLEDLYECSPHINLCYVLDGSGSIHPLDYQMAKQFLYNVTDKISSENGQFCLVLFSSDAQTIYDFQETDKTNRLDRIKMLIHPRDMTNTSGGIQQAVNILESTQTTLPYKTMFILTDGESNYPRGVQPAVSNAQKAGIKSWVWGVGPDVKVTELLEIAYNSAEKFKLEKRYYILDLPKTGGLDLTVQTIKGKLFGYYAYHSHYPSSAVNDGQFTHFIHIPGHNTRRQVFVAIEGQESDNVYRIIATNV